MPVRRPLLSGSELEAHLGALTRALVGAFSPERVVLFGSFARGDQNRASDVDLVVVAETPLPFCERIGRALAACAAASTRTPVEVLVYTPAEWQRMQEGGSSFAAHVLREGRILHEREPEPAGGPALAAPGAA